MSEDQKKVSYLEKSLNGFEAFNPQVSVNTPPPPPPQPIQTNTPPTSNNDNE